MILNLALDGETIGVWMAATQSVLAIPDASSWLHQNDVERIDRSRREQDRRQTRAGRILARLALSESSGGQQNPAAWRFSDDARGRPTATAVPLNLNFSISHAGDCVAVAVGSNVDVGLDIEQIDDATQIGIVPDVLTRQEDAQLNALPPRDRPLHFIRLWTLKEACAKAFSADIDDWSEIDVSDRSNIRLKGRRLHAQAWQETVCCCGKSYQLSLVTLADRYKFERQTANTKSWRPKPPASLNPAKLDWPRLRLRSSARASS